MAEPVAREIEPLARGAEPVAREAREAQKAFDGDGAASCDDDDAVSCDDDDAVSWDEDDAVSWDEYDAVSCDEDARVAWPWQRLGCSMSDSESSTHISPVVTRARLERLDPCAKRDITD